MSRVSKYHPGDSIATPQGNLIFLEKVSIKPRTGYIVGRWQCYCGKIFHTTNRNVTRGTTQSCGCLTQNKQQETAKVNSDFRYLYILHNAIQQRCYNPNRPNYTYYGGRGISLYHSWLDRNIFAQDILTQLGHRPTSKHQLDRIDNNGHYEPGNLQWSLSKDNCRNKSNNLCLEINGEIKTLIAWAESSGLSASLIRERWHRGWRGSKLLEPPQIKQLTISIKYLWHNIKSRCFNPNNPRYAQYGGRGISMQEDWIQNRKKFEQDLITHLGPRPSAQHHLDRINNNGSYEINNLRWVVLSQNNRNTSRNLYLTLDNRTQTLSEWSRELKISCESLKRKFGAQMFRNHPEHK